MYRVVFLGFALLVAACGKKTVDSLCASTVPPPLACNTPCDPAPGAPNQCPASYHCSADGKCDTFCTPSGGQCGDGYVCTLDGYCEVDGGGSGDPPIDAADCPAVHFAATPTIPSIQLLIDRSTSMIENFQNQDPPNPGPYKFPTVQDALVGMQGVVSQLEASVYFGATLYTTVPGETSEARCLQTQSTPRAMNNKAAIATAIGANPPRPRSTPGFTPTYLAINAVVADFAAHPPPPGSPPVIVLATDGIPNECSSTSQKQAETVAAARAAFDAGIKLYILAVSLGGAAATQHIQDVANAGQGVASGAMPYVATNPTQLAAAFQAIIGGVVSCDLKLSGQVNADDGASGNVVLNGRNLVYGTDWTLDADGMTIHLLGTACATLKSSSNPTVDAVFPCGAVIF